MGQTQAAVFLCRQLLRVRADGATGDGGTGGTRGSGGDGGDW